MFGPNRQGEIQGAPSLHLLSITHPAWLQRTICGQSCRVRSCWRERTHTPTCGGLGMVRSTIVPRYLLSARTLRTFRMPCACSRAQPPTVGTRRWTRLGGPCAAGWRPGDRPFPHAACRGGCGSKRSHHRRRLVGRRGQETSQAETIWRRSRHLRHGGLRRIPQQFRKSGKAHAICQALRLQVYAIR